jgi:hypothetical protein
MSSILTCSILSGGVTGIRALIIPRRATLIAAHSVGAKTDGCDEDVRTMDISSPTDQAWGTSAGCRPKSHSSNRVSQPLDPHRGRVGELVDNGMNFSSCITAREITGQNPCEGREEGVTHRSSCSWILVKGIERRMAVKRAAATNTLSLGGEVCSNPNPIVACDIQHNLQWIAAYIAARCNCNCNRRLAQAMAKRMHRYYCPRSWANWTLDAYLSSDKADDARAANESAWR